MYPAIAKITALTTQTATMRPIATADNSSSWVIGLFVASLSVSIKVVVAPDDKIFTVEVVGKGDIVDEAVDVITPFEDVVSG